MKRDYLEALGLEKAQIDGIMAENGKSIETYRNRCLAMEEELNALHETVASLEALKEERARLVEDLNRCTTEAEAFRDGVIASLVAEAAPSSAMASEALCRRLKEEAVRGGDLKEALCHLRETDPDAFRHGNTVLPIFSAAVFAPAEEFPSLSSAIRRR